MPLWTGARKGETKCLRGSEIDLKRGDFRFADTKTGQSLRPLSGPAVSLLRELPRTTGSDYVFPASKGDRHFQTLPKVFDRVVAEAKLEDVTLHTLRHAFASVANELGYTEPTIAAMLGHQLHSTTSRYVHHLDAVLIAAAGRVGRHIEAAMGGSRLDGLADVVSLSTAASR